MEVIDVKSLLHGWVDDGEVGVATHGDDALSGVEAQQFSGVGGSDVGVALQGHALLDHGFGVVHSHAYLDADVAAPHVNDVAPGDLVQVGRKAAVGRGE